METRHDALSDVDENLTRVSRDFTTAHPGNTPSSSHLVASSSLHSTKGAEASSTAIDMRMLDYISEYDNNLMCPICRCPFVDPVVLSDCDHCFCKDCLTQTWNGRAPSRTRGACPTCRSSARVIGKGAVSKILLNILDELEVKCPRHAEGCQARVKRGAISDHVKIYCSYALVECPAEDCDLLVQRRDATTCLHYGVSCRDCHTPMTMADLKSHRKRFCPDRSVVCELCNISIPERVHAIHLNTACLATSIPCPGQTIGCLFRSRREAVDDHAKICSLATLAPVLGAQKRRQDEQEETQRLLLAKLQVLEGGFKAVQDMLSPQKDATVLEPHSQATHGRPAPWDPVDYNDEEPPHVGTAQPLVSPNPWTSGTFASSSTGYSDSFDAPIESQQFVDHLHSMHIAGIPTSTSTAIGPYASPVHHLLSLHENLRGEVSRIATALTELDSRHSMLILNENLRLKEDMAYMGGQVSGVMRQVGWLTSVRLQEQQRPTRQGEGAGESMSSAQSAVSTAATALRGAARMVNDGRESLGLNRRTTDEGRTKL